MPLDNDNSFIDAINKNTKAKEEFANIKLKPMDATIYKKQKK
jgi:hypothetical protein